MDLLRGGNNGSLLIPRVLTSVGHLECLFHCLFEELGMVGTMTSSPLTIFPMTLVPLTWVAVAWLGLVCLAISLSFTLIWLILTWFLVTKLDAFSLEGFEWALASSFHSTSTSSWSTMAVTVSWAWTSKWESMFKWILAILESLHKWVIHVNLGIWLHIWSVFVYHGNNGDWNLFRFVDLQECILVRLGLLAS